MVKWDFVCSGKIGIVSPSRTKSAYTLALSVFLAVTSFTIVASSTRGMTSNQQHVPEKKIWFQQRTRANPNGLPFRLYTPDRGTENPFENRTSINITVPLGDTAFLRCKVKNLGERSISWIRRRDYHILTTGKTTYTNDERFHVLHADGSDEWTLQIKFVQSRDNGTYECQVSTGTGVMSLLVHLNIAVPEAFIQGNDEYHVEQGSTINLVCVIQKSPKPPEYVFWYHNDRMINYGNSREVTVRTEPGVKTHSRLSIRDAHMSDSGNYTCKTAHAEPASIVVYVSQASGLFSGDKIAAIQRRKDSAAASSSIASSSSSSSSSSKTSAFLVLIAVSTATSLWLQSSSSPPPLLLLLSASARTFPVNVCLHPIFFLLCLSIQSCFISRTISLYYLTPELKT